MTIFRGTVLDTPGELGAPDGLRAEQDGAIVVRGQSVVARGAFATVRAQYPHDEVQDLRAGVLLPGLVDTHVHFPQVRIIGGLGMSLLTWLRDRALPEEMRLADTDYARGVAEDFVRGLVRAGTTTAMVFGSHFAGAVDALFSAAERSGLRITSGLVLSDRILHPELLQTPEAALAAGSELAQRWHGRGRLRYAVTPRFSLSTTDAMLEVCQELLGDPAAGRWFTSHLNENVEEVGEVLGLFPGTRHYCDTYHRHGLVTERSVLAHNVHPTDHELELLAGAGAAVAHCPSSNSALGSGHFPLRRHLEAGVRVSLGSDVGAGTGFCLLQEGLHAYLMQQLLGPDGYPLSAADLLHLVTRSGALALGLGEEVGDLSPGKAFDAVWVRPREGGTLELSLRHATDPADALGRIFTLGSPADIAAVWVGGREVAGTQQPAAAAVGTMGAP